MIAEYLKAFFVGAALCMIGQVLIDKTRLTPARILTLGGVRKAVAERGVLGAFTGGFTAGAAGICAAIFFGLLAAMLFRSKDKQ